MFDNILLNKEGDIATITINRPEVRNALDIKTRQELRVAVEDVAEDDSVRVVIFTGAGDKAFVAGADITSFKGLTPAMHLGNAYTVGSLGLFQKIRQMDKPTIAAINGYCLGGGCELAMCCDIRVAAENASFGQPEINIGVIPGAGGTQMLPRLVGIGKAKELCFTGDIINAREAERLGLVNKVVPAEKLQEEVLNLARRIAGKSPLILKYLKRSLNMSLQTNLDNGLAFETETMATCFATEDKDEGVTAFLEKRKPQFKGK
ncbi:MAG: enoyl-CoA hydratase/isomerase family protein [Chloroflexi bacterium]|nr:enoyl-CoA hydratase/isomerase family protein [Chloroflexota bacterium]